MVTQKERGEQASIFMKKVAGGDICPPSAAGGWGGGAGRRERGKNVDISTLRALMGKRRCRERKIKLHSDGNSVWKAIHRELKE